MARPKAPYSQGIEDCEASASRSWLFRVSSASRMRSCSALRAATSCCNASCRSLSDATGSACPDSDKVTAPVWLVSPDVSASEGTPEREEMSTESSWSRPLAGSAEDGSATNPVL